MESIDKQILTPDILLKNGFEELPQIWIRRSFKKTIYFKIEHHRVKTASRSIKVQFCNYKDIPPSIRVMITSLDAKYELWTREDYHVSQFIQVLRVMGYNEIADSFNKSTQA